MACFPRLAICVLLQALVVSALRSGLEVTPGPRAGYQDSDPFGFQVSDLSLARCQLCHRRWSSGCGPPRPRDDENDGPIEGEVAAARPHPHVEVEASGWRLVAAGGSPSNSSLVGAARTKTAW